VLKQYSEVYDLRHATVPGLDMVYGSAHKNILQDSLLYYFDDLTKPEFTQFEQVYTLLKEQLEPCKAADAVYARHETLRNKQQRKAAPHKNTIKLRDELVLKLKTLIATLQSVDIDALLTQLKDTVPYPSEVIGFNDKHGSYTDLYIRRPTVLKLGNGGIPLNVNIKCDDAKLKSTLEGGSIGLEMTCPMQSNAEYATTLTVDTLKPDGDATIVRQKCIELRQAVAAWSQHHSTAAITAATDAALHLQISQPAAAAAAPVSTVVPAVTESLQLPTKATVAHLWNPADCKKAIDVIENERRFWIDDDYYEDFPHTQAEATMTAIGNYFTCVKVACELLGQGNKWAQQRITALTAPKPANDDAGDLDCKPS
jgi:hypothetical protein